MKKCALLVFASASAIAGVFSGQPGDGSVGSETQGEGEQTATGYASRIVGPFNDREEAVEYAINNLLELEGGQIGWIVTEMDDPVPTSQLLESGQQAA